MKFADFVFYCLENNFENADLSKKQVINKNVMLTCTT